MLTCREYACIYAGGCTHYGPNGEECGRRPVQQKNIFAYTAPGSEYPEYVSLNEREGSVVLTLRGPKNARGHVGETVDVTLPPLELWALEDAIAAWKMKTLIVSMHRKLDEQFKDNQ